MPDLPLLTRDLPGIGGVIRSQPEDFFVQEIPIDDPTGDGEHVVAEIQKVGLTTIDLVRRMAKLLRVSDRDIGYAGLKDKHALTRQLISIRGVTLDDLQHIEIPGVNVMWAERHARKIRLGELRGNRFAIRIRQVDALHAVRARAILDVLVKRGCPNGFGPQRFGLRQDNDRLGLLLLLNRPDDLLKQWLGGEPKPTDSDDARTAREAFSTGDLETAHRLWPGGARAELSAIHALRRGASSADAVARVDPKIKSIWLSALQSSVFNRVLARRIDTIDLLMDGDLAIDHHTHTVSRVDDLTSMQELCKAFSVSPTGPLPGSRLDLPERKAGEIEQAVFDEMELTQAMFREGEVRLRAERRSLRVRPTDTHVSATVDEHGSSITLAFTLPAGAFATTLLAEVMKPSDPAALDIGAES